MDLLRYFLVLGALSFGIGCFNAAGKPREPTSCSYSNVPDGPVVNEPCSIRSLKIDGHTADKMTFADGTTVLIEYLKYQSGMSQLKINGSIGIGFLIDREHLKGGTLDLTQQVEWNFN